MGLGVAGVAVLGLTLFFILFSSHFIVGERSFSEEMVFALEALAGFSLGAESIALFARVGGGIYTKAAANNRIDKKVDIIPVANPAIMLVAAPVDEFLIIFITGFLPVPV